MDKQLTRKYDDLIDYLNGFQKVGVACSGGVDSTFLAHACVHALGPEKVIILFGDSKLQSSELRRSIEERLVSELGKAVQVKKVAVDPFSHASFVKNRRDRCYICKKQVYLEFLDELTSLKVDVLLDGTNCDDLQDDRPGLKALEELGIVSPLVKTGFHKEEIRRVAQSLGLRCADLPSNSCLATRIETNSEIDEELLRSIEAMEGFLHRCGYHGCRVRPRGSKVFVEILSGDIGRIAEPSERKKIITYFQEYGYDVVLLDLQGRRR
ncbi:MAG: ATP-dependent sacrificial sulfur transferase LarE [Desulfofustis sp.]|nr:ATP-dependent sacrificial sulfur transferase LarE [Desulfofustis sp.]